MRWEDKKMEEKTVKDKSVLNIYVWVCEKHKHILESPIHLSKWLMKQADEDHKICNIAGCKSNSRYEGHIIIRFPLLMSATWESEI